MAYLKLLKLPKPMAFLHAILAGAILLATTSAFAGKLPLWELEGTEGHVMLMGSVHFLRASDYPLPTKLDAAYTNADTLIMEIDMDDLDPMTVQSILTSMGSNQHGASLQEVIGPEDYAKASEIADNLGIPLALFASFKPWLAALSISQLRMMQLGFDPAWGIESQITERAKADGKPVQGLETFAEQLSFMDDLDSETQQLFLLQSLEDATELQNEVQSIVNAWHAGDTNVLEQLLLEGLQESPLLFDALLTQRNENWVPQIIELSQQPGNHLIIVGAMHLVGENSVLRMLEAQGIGSRQLSD
jgi:uncharacterized protein YbaP (TraB family)